MRRTSRASGKTAVHRATATARSVSAGTLSRAHFAGTHAVKGVFCLRTRFADARGVQCLYESRIILLEAPSEARALAKAKRQFKEGEWRTGRLGKEIVSQSFRFLGINRIVELWGAMEDGEVWYEYSDQAPPLEMNTQRRHRRSDGVGRSARSGRRK